MPKCYLTPVTQHWCCKHWKHCYIDRDLTLFCYLVHGIPLKKSSKEDGFRFVRGTIGHRWIPLTDSRQRGFIFCVSLNKRLNKRSDCQRFEKIGCSLWRYCNVLPNSRQMCNFLFKSYDSPLRYKIDFHAGNTAWCYRKCVRCSSFSIFFFS